MCARSERGGGRRLIGCEERLLPTGYAIDSGEALSVEEERRLFYVAATRAKDRLTLSMAVERVVDVRARAIAVCRRGWSLTPRGNKRHETAAVGGGTRRTGSTGSFRR
jgi:superfamily I DNA/RNA helicase